MLFEVFQPHIQGDGSVIIEHVLLHDLDSILVTGELFSYPFCMTFEMLLFRLFSLIFHFRFIS